MDKKRSSMMIMAAVTVVAALLIGILIPVMSDGARFGGNGSADLSPAVQATLAARQAMVDATAEPNMPIFTATPLAGAVQPTEVPAPTATPTKAPTAAPTEAPTAVPTEAPTEIPTAEVVIPPTVAPTIAPVIEPTAAPVAEATVAPTAAPVVEAPPVESAPVVPGQGGAITVTITTESGMNVRSGPSTQTTALTALPNGAVVPAVGRSADSQWVQIFLADLNANGWVFASLVTIEGDVAALPIAE